MGCDLASNMSNPLVRTHCLCREYIIGCRIVRAVRDVSLEISSGEFVSIMGPSGSGKSTLIGLIGLLDEPTSGQYLLDGIDVNALGPDARSEVRNRHVGFIFQNFRLLPRSTALENVALPLRYAGVGGRERRRRAKAALEAVGLADRLGHWPEQLSGGEQQRVSIARALVNDPSLILADEPTGALDRQNGAEIIARLKQLQSDGRSIIMVTHDIEMARQGDRIIELQEGRVVREGTLFPITQATHPPWSSANAVSESGAT